MNQALYAHMNNKRKMKIYIYIKKKKKSCTRHRWFTPIILATQEAEIRKMEV
jgi:hypothetical protein